MELLVLFFNSFVIGFSGAMMPGPLLAVGIAETPKSGWLTGPVISIGHAIAEIVVVVVLALGVGAIADNATVRHLIGVVGGAALILMAGSMVWDLYKRKIQYQGEGMTEHSKAKLGAKGITATLSNPYWFVWWATVGLALLVKSQALGIAGPVVFYFGHILSDFVWYTVVSILIWKGRKLIMGTGLTVLLLSCALFLVYLGYSFIHDGLTGSI